jgi:hypothetical protein
MKIDFEIAFSIFETIKIVKNKIKSVLVSDSKIKIDDINITIDID